MNNKDFEEEMNEIPPFLKDLKKHDPFKTPKFYFEDLADKVVEKAKTKESFLEAQPTPLHKSPQPSFGVRMREWLSTILRPRYSMALASILFICIGAWYFLKPAPQITETSTFEELTAEDIKDYIKNNIKDFDENLILEKGNIADTEGGDILPQSELNEEEIEKYLHENIDEKDLESLESELQ